MNVCTFCGRLVADPQTGATTGGTPTLKFRLASDTGFGDKKKTHWLNCIAFGDRWQKLAPYLRKGGAVTVAGDLEPPRTYEANGEQRLAQDLIVSNVALQGVKGDAPASGGMDSPAPAKTAPSGSYAAPAPSGNGIDDDIPF